MLIHSLRHPLLLPSIAAFAATQMLSVFAKVNLSGSHNLAHATCLEVAPLLQKQLSEASCLRAAEIYVHLSAARCLRQVARHGANGVWRAANFSYNVADVVGMELVVGGAALFFCLFDILCLWRLWRCRKWQHDYRYARLPASLLPLQQRSLSVLISNTNNNNNIGYIAGISISRSKCAIDTKTGNMVTSA